MVRQHDPYPRLGAFHRQRCVLRPNHANHLHQRREMDVLWPDRVHRVRLRDGSDRQHRHPGAFRLWGRVELDEGVGRQCGMRVPREH
jgi:hypothetical protein